MLQRPSPPLLRTLVLATATTLAQPGAGSCTTEADCALAGDCVGGRCKCDPSWRGENCTELALLPATTDDAAGLRRPNSSSWGGSVIKEKGSGKYFMFFADMAMNCGLDSWQVRLHDWSFELATCCRPPTRCCDVQRNSQISIATSTHPTGPFMVEEGSQPIASPFAHNPTVHGPTLDGYYIIYHIGSGKPSSHGQPLLNCKNGTTPKLGLEPTLPPSQPLPPSVPTMLVSKKLAGPWTSTALPTITQTAAGSDGDGSNGCNNPAAALLNNGTVLLVCKVAVTPPGNWRQMAIYTAPNWRGPYTFRRLTQVYGEDAYVWYDAYRDAFHMIFHSMHPHKVPSTAWSKDGLEWYAQLHGNTTIRRRSSMRS